MRPHIIVKGLGNQSYINTQKDSIYLKGLENLIDIEFPNIGDSIFYQLEGFDSQLLNSAFPKIRYTNLSGGKYLLKYRLSSQKDFKTITVNIEEAIWQKWWFFPMIAFYILLLIGIGFYFFFLYNFRQKMKMQQLRNKISSDLHDEVGSNLSSIAIYTQVLKKGLKDSNLLPILDKITANSKESVTLMQDTVWALNPNNDSPERLFKRIEAYAREVLSEKNISYFQQTDIPMEKVKLDMEDRKNLYLILKEGINNIAKHAEATKASLEVSEKNQKIIFTLTDNGVGFEIDQKTEGNGLRNFKERAEESNFELKIESDAGKGTILSICLSH
ncbi:histidine kinase [Lacihabitans sp. LS3-19]|uniref:ATP-binding protein n=2 Tax=Lacihabitans sp. LS3-19 TaxID=2487335 RepID=UPI0020CD4B4F|nr:histidine kinase [Lacihabitans sp. LS3-19]